MSRILEMLRSTGMYQAMLEQVPEDQREAAIAALEKQVAPYEALLSSLPSNTFDNFMSSINKSKEVAEASGVQPERRPPRRF